MEAITNFLNSTGFAKLGENPLQLVMLAVSCVLLYLAIVKKFEPLLLLPIAFGMLLTNLPGAGIYHAELFEGGHVHWEMFAEGVKLANGSTEAAGLLDVLYLGVKLGVYPCLIFIGVGCMTDFGPLIANPKSLLLGAAAQLGIFVTYVGAVLLGFTPAQAGSIGIIGGADGPTAIFVTSKLAPELLGPIAVAAYSYMALVPVIQPPIMKALTTKKERMIQMKQLRQVTKTEKILFPIVVTIFVSLMLPSAASLVGCLMLGNLLRESGVTERLNKTAQNELMAFKTSRKSKIATIPIGYADGYIRTLKHDAKIIVNGQLAPIVGNICMDQFMIDVTDIPNVKTGDEVILLGESNGIKFNADDIAKCMNSINYEVLCLLKKRVPRAYIKSGQIIHVKNNV